VRSLDGRYGIHYQSDIEEEQNRFSEFCCFLKSNDPSTRSSLFRSTCNGTKKIKSIGGRFTLSKTQTKDNSDANPTNRERNNLSTHFLVTLKLHIAFHSQKNSKLYQKCLLNLKNQIFSSQWALAASRHVSQSILPIVSVVRYNPTLSGLSELSND
jgi:hypothetical protein